MTTPTPSPFALQIDAVADQFEAAWKAGGRPEPRDCLTSLPEAARSGLLVELVRVEVEYRRKAGEPASETQQLQQYRERYADIPGLRPGTSQSPTAATVSDPVAQATGSTSSPASASQFKMVRKLGQGGMGVVMLAHDTLLDRQVAIKVIKTGLPENSSKRLLREATLAARLHHPNAVSIYHAVERRGQVYIVMELLGASLADELNDQGRLPWPQATAAIRDAAAGLAAAHAIGLVHRDIKPSNLLRSPQGGIKVADFGLVDSADAPRLTATGAVLGTPLYMAPEQCRGESADSRSDVYALGCTYYHLLTGQPPFDGADRQELMAKHAKERFPDPRQWVPDLPDAVCHVNATACRKDPALRYPSAAEMLSELEAILAPPAVAATPQAAPPGGRLRIFISSPGDVAEERVAANNLVRRLADEYADRLWIEPVFWEHEPLLAHDTFQSQIPKPSESEVVVCILWSRLGTRLPAAITRPDGSGYASGTEYEFEDAVEGRKKNGYPDLLVYRKTAKPMVDLDDDANLERRRSQKKLLDAFVQKWFFHGEDGTLKAAFHAFEGTADFEQVLEQHLRKLIARRAPAEANRPAAAKPSWTAGSPFRGLDVFEFEHSPIFFGRRQAIGDVLNALRRNAATGRAFVLVVGVSGGGKSSLVRAGVLPVLTQPGVIEGVALWRRAVLKPSDGGGDLLRAVAAALLQPDALSEIGADGTTADKIAALLRHRPDSAFLLIKGGLSQAAAALAREQRLAEQPEARLALVVDQLEELFTLPGVTEAQRKDFVAALSALARSGKVFVIATLRGDFYHDCFKLPELMALQEGAGQYALRMPTPAEIGQMIRQPARAAGLAFEEDPDTKVALEDVLRDDASANPESLPLLEFALESLHERRTPAGLLTYAAYRELGGVEGALTKRAEDVFNALPPEVQASFPRVMRALVKVGQGDVVTRQQAPLESVAPTPPARAFVDAFVKARLFSADRTEQGAAAVRVTHEALLRNWPRVQEWLKQDRELLIVRSRVSLAAARWQAEGRRSDLLLSEGKPLAEAQGLLSAWGDELSKEERALIAASRARQRSRERLKRGAIAALVLLTVTAGLIAAYASRQRSAAQANALRAVLGEVAAKQERDAARRQAYFAAVLYAGVAIERGDWDRARRALAEAPREERRWEWGYFSSQLDTCLAIVRGQPDKANSAAFSPDATRVVMASDDKTARIWDAASGKELAVLRGHLDHVRSAAFSPDGTRVVTTSDDKTARVWDAASGRELAIMRGPDVYFGHPAFSRDGTRVVTKSDDKTAQVWDAASGKELAVLRGHDKALFSAAFSPDGMRVVTASADQTSRVWDAASGKELAVLRGHEYPVVSAAFSPDGTRVVTGSDDKTARTWDAASGKELAVLRGHENVVASATFRPDGTRVVTASWDKTARVWDAASGKELAVLRGHENSVVSAAFSRDGTRLVTASNDKTARVWDSASGKELAALRGHESGVISAAFSPDGTRVVTTSSDLTSRVWDAANGAEQGVLRGHEQGLLSAAFSPDGTRVVTASKDETARIWDATSGKKLAALRGDTAVFSSDGRRVVTASDDKTARVWDATSGNELAAMRGHEKLLYSAVFSPDGMRVVTASVDKTARVWDAASGKELTVLRGHEALLFSAAFSPDGTRVVTASFDKTARVWDAASGKELAVLRGHESEVTSAAFSADGTRVVTASSDDARVWDAASGMELASMRGHDQILTSAAFSPDGTKVVTASNDKTARVWEAASGKELAVLRGHEVNVVSAAFSPDGTRVVTASDDNTARIWDPVSGAELAILRGHLDRVVSAAFSPDGTRVVTASSDKTARVWDSVPRAERYRGAGHPLIFPTRPASHPESGAAQP